MMILMSILACKSSHGIHNDALVYRYTKMVKEDLRMKKAMKRERIRADRYRRSEIRKSKAHHKYSNGRKII
jgi:hypothetical protein